LQKDTSAVESSVPITERFSLKNRIKRIENILDTSKKSDLLNDKNSSSGTTKDTDKESSSSTLKNSAKESSSEQKEIEQLSRDTEREVFGRDKDRADIYIYRMLRKGPHTYAVSSSTSKPYSVIGIYGITGSGKTTLAQYVCDYEKKACHFDPIMFIHVGKTFSVGNIFRDMMEQIT
jgi:chromosomal replication initiation ATPase DnaA